MSVEASDFIAHYGRKGMKWGVVKPEGSYGKTESRENSKSNASVSRAQLADAPKNSAESNRKAKAKQIAIGVGIFAAVAGTAYVGHQLQKNGALKAIDLPKATPAKAKTAAKKILQEPTDVIYMGKPHKDAGVKRRGGQVDTGFRFINKGGTKDYFEVFDNAGLNDETFSVNSMKKLANGAVAAIYSDPQKRVDAATRVIPHAVYIPANKASGYNTIDDVINKLGPELERQYQSSIKAARENNPE